MSSGSREEDGKNQEFEQIGVLEAEFDKCRKQLFSELRKAHGRLRILSLELNEKHTEYNELKKENDTLKETSDKEIKYHQTLNVELKKNIERLNDHIKTMHIDIKTLSCKHRKETEQLEYNLNETKHALTCRENETKVKLTELEYQIDTLKSEKLKLCQKVETLNQKVKCQNSAKEQLEQRGKDSKWFEKSPIPENENQDSVKTLQSVIYTNEVLLTEIDQLKQQMKVIAKDRDEKEKGIKEFCKKEIANQIEIVELQEKLKKLEKKYEEALGTKDVKIKEILKENNTIRQRDFNHESYKNALHQRIIGMTKELKRQESKITKQEEELKELNGTQRQKLSYVASANLTYNNPNIADLSDENRPKKLAEKFSEFYDNEWVDAFDELNFETEREKINFMLDILMKTNAVCSDLSNDHTKRIKDAFCRLTTSSHNTFANIVKRSRVVKKEVVPINLQMEETFESHNKQIDPNEEEDSQTDEEQTGSTAVEFEKDFGLVTKEEISVESDFDLLHKNQKKTIVEAKIFFEIKLSKEVETTVTKLIIGELRQKGMEMYDLLERYIAKCVNICWLMCRQNPPVVIEFPDTKESTPFDTNKYKPYTSYGNFIDYIVWPALYLHENGPLLCKGVAQGLQNKKSK